METAMTKVQTAIPTCHAPDEPTKAFEAMLPTIQRVVFVALLKRSKATLAYPTVLATYAIRQVQDGRQIGCRQNVNDALSPLAVACRRCTQFTIRPPTRLQFATELY